MDEAIRRVFNAPQGRYGSPRVWEEWKAEGWHLGRRRVARRMRALGLKARAARKFKATTQSKHRLPVAPNRLEQDFTASAPNQKWVADITDLWTGEGWLYLAVVLDVYSR
ncbi:MAG: IS3 family transposase [Candidatus Competibacteraceae bacterium]